MPAVAPARVIFHVDMDAFFASVEVLDEPSLAGKPVLVGGRGNRSVVSAASYEARVFGCRSAMPMMRALTLCPQAIVRPVRFERYRQVSQQVFEIFERYTPQIQPISVDEAFLDLTGTTSAADPRATAARIKREVKAETGCTASVGVSHNKFLAKLASDLEKPDGLTLFGPDEVDRILPTLAVNKIWGVGPRTAARLEGYAIRTIGDLRNCDLQWLTNRIGNDAQRYIDLAHGRDAREVVTDRTAKSIGQERTFGTDLDSVDEVRTFLLAEAEEVAARVRRSAVRAGGVSVKIRYGDFETITRSRSLKAPTDITAEIWAAASGIFDAWAAKSFRPVRLIGVTAERLSTLPEAGRQGQLFIDPQSEKQGHVDKAVDAIAAKFGKGTVRRAGAAKPRAKNPPGPEDKE